MGREAEDGLPLARGMAGSRKSLFSTGKEAGSRSQGRGCLQMRVKEAMIPGVEGGGEGLG